MTSLIARVGEIVRTPIFPVIVVGLWAFHFFVRVLPRASTGDSRSVPLSAILSLAFFALPVALVVTNALMKIRHRK
ncbi:MAG TPA: hypothetical protein VFN90_06785 [Gemmatimonadales bacterium]|nr:hypothetical protein [Gemmatimonadales bacterium]